MSEVGECPVAEVLRNAPAVPNNDFPAESEEAAQDIADVLDIGVPKE
jgi:hypothetical protein